MKHFVGQCYLGQHVRGSGYVYLPFVSFTLVEPFIEISNDEMRKEGLSILLHWLRKGPNPGYRNVSLFDLSTKNKMLKLKKENSIVSVELLQGTCPEMKVVPLHFGRGWSIDMLKEEIRFIKLPTTNERFFQEMKELFEMAS